MRPTSMILHLPATSGTGVRLASGQVQDHRTGRAGAAPAAAAGRKRCRAAAGGAVGSRTLPVRESTPTVHRPGDAAPGAGRPGRPRHEPALVLAPGHARPVRVRGPGAVAGLRRRPGAAARRGVARSGWPRWPRTSASCRRLPDAADDLTDYLAQPRWYQELGRRARAASRTSRMEFGLTEVLPQYSGGLGILAGDHLKAASDLGVPIIGVGLLYRSGYFAQGLSRDGWQQEHYPSIDPHGLPLAAGPGRRRQPPLQVSVGLPDGAHAARPGVAGAGRPGAAAAARLRHRGERGRPSGRSPTSSTAGRPSTGWRRRCSPASAASARSGRTAS